MSLTATGARHGAVEDTATPDPLEPLARLFRDLRSSPGGSASLVTEGRCRQWD
jgi:hypothetical protein